MRSDARQKMIDSAVLLFRERGIDGTAFSDVLAHSGAPRGSIYHHFPEGKAQLAREATERAGELMAGLFERQLTAAGPAAAIDAFVAFWRTTLTSSDFEAGCPIAAAAVAGHDTPGARDAAGVAFARFQELCAADLVARGVEPERAASVAALVVSAVEGAVILCRAQRSLEPLERTAAEISRMIGERPELAVP
jgi:AcrR family transcriptional regulator